MVYAHGSRLEPTRAQPKRASSARMDGVWNQVDAEVSLALIAVECALSNTEMLEYPECIQCQFGNAPTNYLMTSCQGCQDGYVKSDGSCTSSCGAGSYGSATYGDTSFLSTSQCNAGCAANCYECMGAATNQCLSCDKGFYLNKANFGVSYGTCTAKAGGPGTATLYVGSPVTGSPAACGAVYANVQAVDATDINTPYLYL